jgi:hypothetical protein
MRETDHPHLSPSHRAIPQTASSPVSMVFRHHDRGVSHGTLLLSMATPPLGILGEAAEAEPCRFQDTKKDTKTALHIPSGGAGGCRGEL